MSNGNGSTVGGAIVGGSSVSVGNKTAVHVAVRVGKGNGGWVLVGGGGLVGANVSVGAGVEVGIKTNVAVGKKLDVGNPGRNCVGVGNSGGKPVLVTSESGVHDAVTALVGLPSVIPPDCVAVAGVPVPSIT